jgi:flagellar biosynthesis GTPase FlhF
MSSSGSDKSSRYIPYIPLPSSYGIHGGFFDITEEMIEDYLSPVSKSMRGKAVLEFLPPATTGGRGLLVQNIKEEEEDEHYRKKELEKKNNEILRERINNNDFRYVKEQRIKIEMELRQQYKQTDSVINQDENSSIIGSNVSQLESLTTINMPIREKQILMKQSELLANHREPIGEAEDEVDIERDISLQNFDINDPNLPQQLTMKQTREQQLKKTLSEYKERTRYSSNLPINNLHDEIMQNISLNNFVIIQGSTGCGKTTQVPQVIFYFIIHFFISYHFD